jgi:hypothetical protein
VKWCFSLTVVSLLQSVVVSLLQSVSVVVRLVLTDAKNVEKIQPGGSFSAVQNVEKIQPGGSFLAVQNALRAFFFNETC